MSFIIFINLEQLGYEAYDESVGLNTKWEIEVRMSKKYLVAEGWFYFIKSIYFIWFKDQGVFFKKMM